MTRASDPWVRRENIGDATLYLGDCLDILPTLPKVDAVITDPPYGIASKWVGGFSGKHGWGKAKDESITRNEWDQKPPSKEFFENLDAEVQIIWGGNYFDLPPARGWLVWNKPERNFTLAEAELAWTNRDNVVRVFDGNRSDVGRVHPTQKPLALMEWCIKHADKEIWKTRIAQTILDPFMGSGTTGVACAQLGRKFVGIEIEPKYFDIACERIDNAYRQQKLFA